MAPSAAGHPANVLENPGWLHRLHPVPGRDRTGRLEALLNFQTVVSDLTGLEIANASLLDEGTAAAEAMALTLAMVKHTGTAVYLIDAACHPQTIAVVQTRAEARGVETVVGDPSQFDFASGERGTVVGCLLQYPATDGAVRDWRDVTERAHAQGAAVTAATDLMALALLASPARGRGHRGRQLAALRRTAGLRWPPCRLLRDEGCVQAQYSGANHRRVARHRRPPRTAHGAADPRAAHPSRQGDEQRLHRTGAAGSDGGDVRCLSWTGRDQADCRAGAWPGGAAGPGSATPGLRCRPRELLRHRVGGGRAVAAGPGHRGGEARRINLRRLGRDRVVVALDETVTLGDLADLIACFALGHSLPFMVEAESVSSDEAIGSAMRRTTDFLTHPVFRLHRSETEMLRYLRGLEAKDLSLTAAMIPLGSCTMKLNATTEMMPVSFPGLSKLHPFAPREQAQGYAELFRQLEDELCEITGFAKVSLQPNAGSQGEYAGLLAIRAYHRSRVTRTAGLPDPDERTRHQPRQLR